MGGGGGSEGGGAGGGDWNSVRDLISSWNEAGDDVDRAGYETDLESLIAVLLSEYNNRPTEAIARHLAEIRAAFASEFDSSVDTLFGGSVAKHTYVDGISDVDALVRLDDNSLQQADPAEVLEYFGTRLRQRFPNPEIRIGSIAVTILFADAKIQLVPAIRRKRELRVPDGQGAWATARPWIFARALTEANKQQSGRLVPTIKLAKAMLADMPERIRPTGYHLEAMAIEAFRDYQGRAAYAPMLEHLMRESARLVLEPMRDRTKQTLYVDSYLGRSRTPERRILANTLARLAREMRVADMTRSIADWARILEGELV